MIHCVHKANILKLADGLFLEAFRATAKEFPEMQAKEIIVDNCCMQMVARPQQFDVLVMGNLYGDIVSDLGAGVVGGISATAGINIGDGIQFYECFHGAGRERIGVDRANPLPLAVAGDRSARRRRPKRRGRAHFARDGNGPQRRNRRTSDLGGTATTTAMTDALIRALEQKG